MGQVVQIEWDSSFFGFPVGKLLFSRREDVLKLKYDQNKLIYVFSDTDISDLSIENRTLDLVDVKIVYEIATEKVPSLSETRIEEIFESSKGLYDLAYLSGKYSRYALDKRIDRSKFEELYRLWIDNTLNKSIGDYVFGIIEDNDLKAFVTLSISRDYGTIGLIATTEQGQRKGYGRRLIDKCVETLYKKSIRRLVVATQEGNVVASSFYEKYGMKMNCKTYIYHSWKIDDTI